MWVRMTVCSLNKQISVLKLTFSHHLFSIQIFYIVTHTYNLHNYCAFVGPEIFLALYWSGYTSFFLIKTCKYLLLFIFQY